MTTKQTILHLIKADLRNAKLLIGLEQAGLQPDDFHTDLDSLVFDFMGFPKNPAREALHDFYYIQMEALITELPLKTFRQQLSQIAEELYLILLAQKQKP
jgi:hypothetical protein